MASSSESARDHQDLSSIHLLHPGLSRARRADARARRLGLGSGLGSGLGLGLGSALGSWLASSLASLNPDYTKTPSLLLYICYFLFALQLRMIFDNFSYFHPESCEDHFERQLEATISVDSEISDAFTFRNLLPSASYYLTIQAVNGNGASAFSPFVICDTLTCTKVISANLKFQFILFSKFSAPSSKVENLFVKQQQQQIGEAFNKTKEIQWGIPCRANGKIIKFLVDTSTVLDGITPATHYEVEVKGEEEEFSFSTDDFLPDTKYKIAVQAVSEANDGGLVYGVETYSEVEMNAGRKRSLTINFSIGHLYRNIF